jgi:hypothetical protein
VQNRLPFSATAIELGPERGALPQRKPVLAARKLLVGAKPDYVEIGRLARAARHAGGFKAFCDEVPIHSRKAYDLIAIADAVDAGFLAAEVVSELGWTKVRFIASRARTKSAARSALTFARKNTVPAIVAYLRAPMAAEKLITKSFNLTVKQARELELALDRAGARRRHGRIDNRAESLMRIIRAYG